MNFVDLYTLKRAGRYTSPLNSNDRLPVVYGDLTDGSSGNWTLPCISTTSYVYCFAGHAVLSVALGNSINIYADDVLVAPAGYTFDESNDYESLGAISTVTFTSDQANKVITARGQGKPSGSSLMTNLIDILYDFLTVENSFTSADVESTSKNTASALFTKQGYTAAGVIDQDGILWDLIAEMAASFLGSAWLNYEGKLVIELDDGTYTKEPAAIIPKHEISFSSAVQRLISVINRCPASYAYNYAQGEFRSHDSGTTTDSSSSQGIYGVREPSSPYKFYWCRAVASINKMQTIITGAYGSPQWEIEFNDLSLKRAFVDVGDVVAVTFDDLYDINGHNLINEHIRVLSIKHDAGTGKVGFRGVDTGYFMTTAYLADGTYDADGSIKAGGERDTTIY